MKRIVIAALALALLPGLAVAQSITKSLQGSQDPRGPVGMDTSNSAYFPGHINAFGQTGALSVSTCGTLTAGTSPIVSGSTDAAGAVIPFSNACQVYFGSPYNSAPWCITQMTSQPVPGTTVLSTYVTTTTTGMIMSSTTSGAQINWICIGNK